MKCSNSIAVYRDGLWQCANCGSIACANDYNELDLLFDSRVMKEDKKCECGAERTYGAGTNTHAFWCPKYVK